jgi:hypothetical protein
MARRESIATATADGAKHARECPAQAVGAALATEGEALTQIQLQLLTAVKAACCTPERWGAQRLTFRAFDGILRSSDRPGS